MHFVQIIQNAFSVTISIKLQYFAIIIFIELFFSSMVSGFDMVSGFYFYILMNFIWI